MADLNPGDRVKHIFTGAEMTVTGPGYFGDEIEVRTGNGGKEYVDPFLVEPIDGKEKDRSGLAKVTATANETNTQKERDFMSNSTFKPGDIVRDTETGDFYRVASTEDEFGYVGFYRISPQVEHILPRFIEHADTDQGDAQPMEEPEEPKHPESELHARLIDWGASERTTVHQLIRFALDTEIDVKALFNAYASLGFIPNGGSNNV
ncbi:hypothetical protein ACTXOF_03900 [Glutamicibacter arilaitensis]|uniref:hypothetical protein n=1 Tax=Glutamicibacter arilaitensis TaxID=256701 RepID=UPI003FD32D66